MAIEDSRSNEKIGERLRLTREVLGMSQVHFARKADVSPPAYNQFEKGRMRPAIVMQNTLEQLIWFALCVMPLATYLTPTQARGIPVVCTYFAPARFSAKSTAACSMRYSGAGGTAPTADPARARPRPCAHLLPISARATTRAALNGRALNGHRSSGGPPREL
jgi:transcriptional regulator with XRE-family HTH domain